MDIVFMKCTYKRRRKWQPTPVFLPGKSHGWQSLVGYSPRGHKESDTTERLSFFLFYKRRRNRTRVNSKAVTFSERSTLEWSVYHHSGWTMIPLEVLILKPLENLKSSRICYFSLKITVIRAFLVAQLVKNPPAVREIWARSLGWEEPLEKGGGCTLWPGEFHGLYSPWGRRVRHDWVTFTSLLFFSPIPWTLLPSPYFLFFTSLSFIYLFIFYF